MPRGILRGIAALVLVALCPAPGRAESPFVDTPSFLEYFLEEPVLQPPANTIWVGHSAAGPPGGYLGVHVDGTWDFDSDYSQTDSTQGWSAWTLPYTGGVSLPVGSVGVPLDRSAWFYPTGNAINRGDRNLWGARSGVNRRFVKTGICGAWHQDDMAGVSAPIDGDGSAWCGLRRSGDAHRVDPVTSNPINADLTIGRGADRSEYPGYGDLWDQLLYKDFPAPGGTGTIAFTVRTDLSLESVDPIVGTHGNHGWFNPSSADFANLVTDDPADSFMVYVGSPTEAAYDLDRRSLEEVLDLAQPVQELAALAGSHGATAYLLPFAGLNPGTIRVVFRVKTNRFSSDHDPVAVGSFDSVDGAAVIDAVSLNGGPVYSFESVSDIQARSAIPNLATVGGPWASTGKPAAAHGHVDDVMFGPLLYDDLCGVFASPTSRCGLEGRVLVSGNAEPASNDPVAEWGVVEYLESPTIDLAPTGGGTNAQGLSGAATTARQVLLEYDVYAGFMGLLNGVFYRPAARYFGVPPGSLPGTLPRWSGVMTGPTYHETAQPYCLHMVADLGSMAIPFGDIDSLRVGFEVLCDYGRFGGLLFDTSRPRGVYVDNVRVGFVPGGRSPMAVEPWNHLQDTFPFDEAIAPGSAAFDRATAPIKTGLNTVEPVTDPGIVPGDSLVAMAGFEDGNGVTTGVRMDFVFRIDPGPGCHSVLGDRSSPLVEPNPAHPFWTTYRQNVGPFGSSGSGQDVIGGQGMPGTWDKNYWCSARMDTAELNLIPDLRRDIGGPATGRWMGTLHESDRNFAVLGNQHPVCYVTDANGPVEGNVQCGGTPPASAQAAWYSAPGGSPGVAVTTEGTKILPDGMFTPGTHIEYFIRRSRLGSPNVYELLPDTSRAQGQGIAPFADLELQRWEHVDVLPNLWRDPRFLDGEAGHGEGLACMLFVDVSHRRGTGSVARGTLDSLGYGRLDGASQGWKVVDPGPAAAVPPGGRHPNNPVGFVAPNYGQAGGSYDLYCVRGAESAESGTLGMRLATPLGAAAPKRGTQGPSLAMLEHYYKTILYSTGNLTYGAIEDGEGVGTSSNEISLLKSYLLGAPGTDPRGLWLSGSGLPYGWGANLSSADTYELLSDYLGIDNFFYQHYTPWSQFPAARSIEPTQPWLSAPSYFGLAYECTRSVWSIGYSSLFIPAYSAGDYYSAAGNTTSAASVLVDGSTGTPPFRALVDGFDLANLRGFDTDYQDFTQLMESDQGRHYWIREVLASYFKTCPPSGPPVLLVDGPGPSGGASVDRLLGVTPNPVTSGGAAALRFTLARSQIVTIGIYDVTGREIRRSAMAGRAGANSFAWDLRTDQGRRAAPGVYFYRLDGAAGRVEGGENRIILLAGLR